MKGKPQYRAAPDGAAATRAIGAVIWSSFLLRSGQSAASVIIGFYLAYLKGQGAPVAAITAALLLSSSYVVELAVSPFLGALSDRYGRKLFIILGPLIGLLAIQVYPLSAALAVLFLARGLEGLASGTLTPATLGFLADNTASGHEHRGRTMAYYEIATLVGIGFGYAVGGLLWQRLGLNSFRAAAGFYLLSAIAVWVGVAHTQQVRRVVQTGLRDYLAVVRQPRILRFAPAWLCVTAVIGLWFNNLIFQLAGPHRPGQPLTGGFSGSQVSAILGGFVVVLIAGTFGWSRLFGRFPRKTSIMLIALGGMFAVCVDLLALNHRGATSGIGMFALLAILALAVATESGFTPAALAYLADITEDFPADRGVIMGLYSIFLGVGEVTGGVAGGPFAQMWGLNGMVYLTLILAAAAMVTVLVLRRYDARKPAAAGGLRSSGRPARMHVFE